MVKNITADEARNKAFAHLDSKQITSRVLGEIYSEIKELVEQDAIFNMTKACYINSEQAHDVTSDLLGSGFDVRSVRAGDENIVHLYISW